MASTAPSSSNGAATAEAQNKHALTPVERQRAQLSRLLKDPSKPAYVPSPPKERTIRPPREMMKNVQGSSAGAGSGEFHVYKANRRREYERLKIMEDASQKETITAEFERKRKEWEDQAEAKTSKNRAKRMKKKERAAKGKSKEGDHGEEEAATKSGVAAGGEGPIRKRRLVNGKEVLFRKRDEVSDEEGEEGGVAMDNENEDVGTRQAQVMDSSPPAPGPAPSVLPSKLTIHDSDT